MAKRFSTNVDLFRNELQNAKIQNLAADPATPTAGQIYYNTTAQAIYFYNGTVFGPVGVTIAPATTVSAMNAFGLASVVGSLTTYAREDHRHSTPTAPSASSVGAVANAGNATSLQTGTAAARPTTGQTVGNIYVDNDDTLLFIATSATTFTQLAAFGVTAPVSVGSGAAAVGVATSYSRSDHLHAATTATAGSSAVGDTASAGSGTSLSLATHVHGREAFGTPTAQTTFGAASASGVATTVSRSDHAHGTPTTPTAAQTGAVANAGGVTSAQSGTAATRPTTGQVAGNLYLDNDDFLLYIATSATTFAQLAPFALAAAITTGTLATAAAAGTALTYARGDHQHAMGTPTAATSSTVTDTASAGSNSTPARSDHVHGREGFGAVSSSTTFGQAAAAGSAATVAHSDHVHGTPAAPTATSVGAVGNNGAAPGLQTGVAGSRPTTGQTIGNIYVDNDDTLLYIATSPTTFTQLAAFGAAGAMVATSGSTTGAGTSTSYSRIDHNHGLGTAVAAGSSAVADTATSGTSATAARADHVHGRESFGTVATQTTFAAASGNGAATTVARSDHTHGTPTHIGTDHAAVSLSSLSAPTANLSIGGFRVTNVADPLNPQDVSTKNYVDNAVAGLVWKSPARVASTANIAIATALINASVIDGVTVATGDRVLLKNQTATAENGIYVVVATGAASRSTDANTVAQLVGAAVYVESGTVAASQVYNLISPTSVTGFTLGTTGITWSQFSGASVATAGAGLTATGNIFAVGAGAGIVVNADSVTVDRTTNGSIVPLKYAQAFGDGAATSYVITHNLGTQDVEVTVYTNSGVFDEIECDIQHTSTNTVTLLFSVAPTASQYRVVVMG